MRKNGSKGHIVPTVPDCQRALQTRVTGGFLPQAIASSMPFVTGPQAVVCAVSAAASSVGPEARAQFSLPPNWTQTWHSIPWLRNVFHARKATKAAIPRIVRSLLRVADMDRGERTPGSDFANVVSHPLQIRLVSRQ